MPCLGPTPEEMSFADRKKIKFLEACLCAVLSLYDKEDNAADLISAIDEKESGIKTDELYRWWINHKEEDRRRKEAEKRRLEITIKRRAALDKLSHEEKVLLNLDKVRANDC